MRSRKRKNGEARMEACGEIILPFDKENIEKVSLEELFPEKKSFRIEIGCGKADLRGEKCAHTFSRSPRRRCRRQCFCSAGIR